MSWHHFLKILRLLSPSSWLILSITSPLFYFLLSILYLKPLLSIASLLVTVKHNIHYYWEVLIDLHKSPFSPDNWALHSVIFVFSCFNCTMQDPFLSQYTYACSMFYILLSLYYSWLLLHLSETPLAAISNSNSKVIGICPNM